MKYVAIHIREDLLKGLEYKSKFNNKLNNNEEVVIYTDSMYIVNSITKWAKKWDFYTDKFPPSRRKLEWQAQDTPSLWETVMHFRPSGIRAKRPTYLPALVAITQTSIIGSRKRRLSTREAARLQGLPDWFNFGSQPNSATYKQLGNGVSVGAVWYVVRKAVQENATVLKKYSPNLVKAVLNAPDSPDEALEQH